jgi:hypothetical protein
MSKGTCSDFLYMVAQDHWNAARILRNGKTGRRENEGS